MVEKPGGGRGRLALGMLRNSCKEQSAWAVSSACRLQALPSPPSRTLPRDRVAPSGTRRTLTLVPGMTSTPLGMLVFPSPTRVSPQFQSQGRSGSCGRLGWKDAVGLRAGLYSHLYLYARASDEQHAAPGERPAHQGALGKIQICGRFCAAPPPPPFFFFVLSELNQINHTQCREWKGGATA
jgi:hypothetical protein